MSMKEINSFKLNYKKTEQKWALNIKELNQHWLEKEKTYLNNLNDQRVRYLHLVNLRKKEAGQFFIHLKREMKAQQQYHAKQIEQKIAFYEKGEFAQKHESHIKQMESQIVFYKDKLAKQKEHVLKSVESKISWIQCEKEKLEDRLVHLCSEMKMRDRENKERLERERVSVSRNFHLILSKEKQEYYSAVKSLEKEKAKQAKVQKKEIELVQKKSEDRVKALKEESKMRAMEFDLNKKNIIQHHKDQLTANISLISRQYVDQLKTGKKEYLDQINILERKNKEYQKNILDMQKQHDVEKEKLENDFKNRLLEQKKSHEHNTQDILEEKELQAQEFKTLLDEEYKKHGMEMKSTLEECRLKYETKLNEVLNLEREKEEHYKRSLQSQKQLHLQKLNSLLSEMEARSIEHEKELVKQKNMFHDNTKMKVKDEVEKHKKDYLLQLNQEREKTEVFRQELEQARHTYKEQLQLSLIERKAQVKKYFEELKQLKTRHAKDVELLLSQERKKHSDEIRSEALKYKARVEDFISHALIKQQEYQSLDMDLKLKKQREEYEKTLSEHKNLLLLKEGDHNKEIAAMKQDFQTKHQFDLNKWNQAAKAAAQFREKYQSLKKGWNDKLLDVIKKRGLQIEEMTLKQVLEKKQWKLKLDQKIKEVEQSFHKETVRLKLEHEKQLQNLSASQNDKYKKDSNEKQNMIDELKREVEHLSSFAVNCEREAKKELEKTMAELRGHSRQKEQLELAKLKHHYETLINDTAVIHEQELKNAEEKYKEKYSIQLEELDQKMIALQEEHDDRMHKLKVDMENEFIAFKRNKEINQDLEKKQMEGLQKNVKDLKARLSLKDYKINHIELEQSNQIKIMAKLEEDNKLLVEKNKNLQVLWESQHPEMEEQKKQIKKLISLNRELSKQIDPKAYSKGTVKSDVSDSEKKGTGKKEKADKELKKIISDIHFQNSPPKA